jgi:hypothetical protein
MERASLPLINDSKIASQIAQNIGQYEAHNLLVIRKVVPKIFLDFAFRPCKNEHAKKDFSQKRSQR